MSQQSTDFSAWDLGFSLAPFVSGDAGRLLSEYAKIPPEKIEGHIRAIAKRGWDKLHYPCFKMCLFLHFDLAQSPIYDEILSRVKNGSVVFDLGCGLGQDIRRLVYDGAPPENLIGLDIYQEYIDLGFELFHDRDRLSSTTFIARDFFDYHLNLMQWANRHKIVNSGYFMHLWNWDGQVKVAKRILESMCLQKDDIITGVHFGSAETGTWKEDPISKDPMYRHNSKTFSRLWEQVGRETKTRWAVWSTMEHDKYLVKLDPNGLRLRWYVRFLGEESKI
ncbi:hypothetical protein AFLA70_228g001690 [Aspergillus flavus AF70]|nr:hypothetical protein AFLA70_228g001690 [Aspergillus flavus AF70]